MSILGWFGHVERMSESRLTKGGNAGALDPLALLVKFFRKVRRVELATGVRV